MSADPDDDEEADLPIEAGSLLSAREMMRTDLPTITEPGAAAIVTVGLEGAVGAARRALDSQLEALPTSKLATALNKARRDKIRELRVKLANGGELATNELEALLMAEGVTMLARSRKQDPKARDAGTKLLLELHRRRHAEQLAGIKRTTARSKPKASGEGQTF